MPFAIPVLLRIAHWAGSGAVRWALRYRFAGYIASLALDAAKRPEDQHAYRNTLDGAKGYPSPTRRVFFEILKSIVEEAVWAAFLQHAIYAAKTDPTLEDVAADVIAS